MLIYDNGSPKKDLKLKSPIANQVMKNKGKYMCRMAFQRAESGASSAMEKSLTWLKASHGKRNIVCLRTFLFYDVAYFSFQL